MNSIQMKDVDDLKKRWGDKPCNHPRLLKEYHMSMATGDYVCAQCGKTGWGSDWNRKKEN
jgi:hypothetical protein